VPDLEHPFPTLQPAKPDDLGRVPIPDDASNVTEIVDQSGSILAYGHDDLGKRDALSLQLLRTSMSRSARVARPHVHAARERRAWEPGDLPASSGATGVRGDTTESWEYDARGRLTRAQDDDSTVQYTYDSLASGEAANFRSSRLRGGS
jgi:hypothetical protein